MEFCLVALMFPVALAAQQGDVTVVGPQASQPQTSAQASETKPEDRCAIEGHVLNAATGEPIKKANLILRRVDLNPGFGVIPTSYTPCFDCVKLSRIALAYGQ